MASASDNVAMLEMQLAQKSELVAALTAQLEKTATQLDRLTRAGAERLRPTAPAPAASPDTSDLTQKVASVLENWEEFQPVERIERIENGIEQILTLLSKQPVVSAPPTSEPSNEDFWAATKARLLGELPDDSQTSLPTVPELARESAQVSSAVGSEPDSLMGLLSEISGAPEPPEEVSPMADTKELLRGLKSRDEYIQYLTRRLRLIECQKFKPLNWDQFADAPDDYRTRLEALEKLLEDHLRQAEVAHSLERAMLARERAKLAQVKQNLEMQIRKLAMPDQTQILPAIPTQTPPSSSSGSQEVPDSAPESRWKRIFSR